MITGAPALKFAEPVLRGRFLRRYKRFFVDVDIDGVEHTAHTANTGAMTGLLVEGAPVILTRHDGTKRKFPLELEAIDVGTGFVAVNTIRANRVVRAFIEGGVFPELGMIVDGAEVKTDDSRVDFVVGKRLVEVKSVTLRQGRSAAFPDARSERATKHAAMLQRHAADPGAAIIFLCQRNDVDEVVPADAIDPVYGAALRAASAAGVLLYAAAVQVIDNVDGGAGIACARRLPVRLP